MSGNCGGIYDNRDFYLKQLIDKQHSSKIKIITGLRRSGKSYLLGEIYKQYLGRNGVANEQIIIIELDNEKNDELLKKTNLYRVLSFKYSFNELTAASPSVL